MIARNLKNIDELNKALKIINKTYKKNIVFKETPEAVNAKGTAFKFGLRAIDCKKSGGRLGQPHAGWTTRSGKEYKQRHIGGCACWHVHGEFFEALLNINPEAVIHAGAHKITSEGGNWEDWNIGSMSEPFYYSEACNCE